MDVNLKKQPVVIVFSILAGLQVINGGLALIDSIDKDWAGLFSLILGAVTAAASLYVRGMVTPWSQVVSKIQDGHVVAGPAAGEAGTSPLEPHPPAPPTPETPPETPPVNP